jgi:hypothetical protein
MVLCPNCKREIMPQAKFCISCWSSVYPAQSESYKTLKSYFQKKIVLAALLVLIIASSIIFFEFKLKTNTESLKTTGTFIFIEQRTHIHGETIEGDYPRVMIDFPTYSFNEKNGTLSGMVNFEINETLKAIYGSGLVLSGAAGGGASTGLDGIFDLPFRKDDFQLLKIDIDGTANIVYRGLSITLRKGEEWTNTTSTIDSKEAGNFKGKAMLTITDEIINHGILEKSKVIRKGP